MTEAIALAPSSFLKKYTRKVLDAEGRASEGFTRIMGKKTGVGWARAIARLTYFSKE